MTNMTNTRDRICEILRATERPGIEAVINYLLTSSYFKRGCYATTRSTEALPGTPLRCMSICSRIQAVTPLTALP